MYFGLQFNKANLARLLAAGGGIVRSFSGGTTGLTPSAPTTGNIVLDGALNIAHGGTGATTATAALANLGVPVFSVLNYGAIADGVRTSGHVTGQGTDITANFQAALDAADAAGGGIAIVPPNGSNIYLLDGQLTLYPNVSLVIDDAVTIDTSNADASKPSLTVSGSIGSEVNLASQIVAGATSIPLAAPHLAAVGDTYLLMSTINALSANTTGATWTAQNVLDWRLGTPTGTQKVFLGELVTAYDVSTPDTLIASGPVFFPIYPTIEVGSSGRTCSTVAKIDWVENCWVIGGNFERWEAVQADTGDDVIYMKYARNSGVRGTRFHLGTKTGAAVTFDLCSGCEMDELEARHTPGFAYAGSSAFNSFKLLGGWNNKLKVIDRDGAQGPDETYLTGYPCAMHNTFGGVSYDNQQDGLTSHGGSYGFSIDGFKAFGCENTGINNRARFFKISNVDLGSTSSGTTSGIIRLGTFATDGLITDFVIRGGAYGFTTPSTLVGAGYPRNKNLRIQNGQVIGCTKGVVLTTLDDVYEADEDCGVVIDNVDFVRFVTTGIEVGPYNNAVVVKDCKFVAPTGATPICIDNQANAVRGVYMFNIYDTMPTAATLVNVPSLTDTTLYPSGTYPSANPQVQLGFDRINGARPTTPYVYPTLDRTVGNLIIGPRGPVVISGNPGGSQITSAAFMNNNSNNVLCLASASATAQWALGSPATPLQGGVSYNNSTDILNLRSGGATKVTVDASGNTATVGSLKSSAATGGVGYATGAGGAVTQLTDKSTTVILNTAAGAITMNAATLNANTAVSFTLTNSVIAATDTMTLTHASVGNLGDYSFSYRCGSGSAVIRVLNTTGGNLSEAIVIQFAIIKAVSA